MGLGIMKKMTSQQAAPASVATQTVSARPEASATRHRAIAAPAQMGRSKIATVSLNHFNTRESKRDESKRDQPKEATQQLSGAS